MRALRERPTALERWPKGVREDIKLATGRRDKADAFYSKRVPKGAPDYVETVEHHVPVGPHRRRDLPDRDRHGGVGRADGHDHLPPLAGTSRRRRPPRRAAHRPRPAARHRLRRRRPGRAGVARDLLTELGLVGFPKTSGNRGVHVYVRIEPRWDFVDVRHAAIAFGRELERRTHGRDHELVEGGARREHLRRLQPELPRPHDRQRLLPAARSPGARSPRRWSGTSSTVPTRGRSTCTRCRSGSPSAATRWRPSTTHARRPRDAAADVRRRHRPRAADMPYPPDYPKMPGEPPRVQPSRKNPLNWENE